MYKTLAVLVVLGVACFAQAPPSPTPSLRDHNIVVGARYNDVIDTLILGANAEAQAYQGNTNHHAELSVQKLLPENTEVHGVVGENNLNVYTNAGLSTNRFTNGLNFSGKGDVYYRKDNLTHLAEVSLAKVFEVASVVLTGGEKNLNPYARALISAAQEVAGFNVNETASLHFENNVFGNQLIVQTARALSDYLTLYLRGQVTDLRDPQALARAVLANTTVLGANVNGYAQAGLASNNLAYEAAVYATKLIAERFATKAFAGFHQTSPFAGAETSFHTDLADITAGVNANYTLGALFNAYARASRQFTQNLNGLLEGSVSGANLEGASKRLHGAVHYNENTTRGRVYANADGVYQNGQLLKSANAGVAERLTENDLLTDDLTYDVNSVINNRATLSGAHTFSNLLFNYVITGLTDNRSGSLNNVVTAAANTTLYENFFAGVRGFYERELQGLGAYLATRGNLGQFTYKAGIAGDVNSTKSAEVRAGGLLTGLIQGLNLTLVGTGVSDITTNDIITLSTIVSNTVQSLTVSAKKNLRGPQQQVDAEYSYTINPNLVLNLGVHFPAGAKAYAEGTLRRTSGAQNVLLYFSVDQFGQISFKN